MAQMNLSSIRIRLGIRKIVANRIFIAIVALVMLFVFGEIIFPGFLNFTHIMSVLRLSVFLGIVALGQTLVVIAGNEGIDLSVGSVLSIGVVMTAYILNSKNINIPIALFGVPAIGFLLGIVNGLGISYIGIPPLIMTLAMASVIEGLSLIITKGFPTGTAPSFLELIGNGRVLNIPYIIIVWIMIIIVTMVVLKCTKWGNLLFGVGANGLTAELSGVNVKLFRMIVYGISGAVSAFAGLLMLSYTGTPYLNLGAPYLMASVAAVAIGGISLAGGSGSYIGTVLGCIVLTTLNSILVALQSTEAIRQIAYGSLLFVLVIVYTGRKRE